jgi:alkanesulfonate monooxygenase SsuD/methylene tetrahydromethanopterin reductase-like flavin-dependent oxidoreductase (luciferase family)
MRDYGRPLQFGVFLTPDAAAPQEVLRLARAADAAGLDLIGIQDHPYQPRFLDTWTLLSAIAAQTERVRLFPDVANLPLRPPAMLAKAAASLDLLSGGRVELGLGAGAFWEAIAGMGGPTRTPPEAVVSLEEAIHVIRLLWSRERSARFEGRFYQLLGARPGPAPAHPIGIWLGVLGPRMLELTGRLADGWVPSSSYASPERLPEMHDRIDAGVAAAGRSPADIQRVYNVMGRITASASEGFLQGPTDQWVDDLVQLTRVYGMDTFIFAPAEASAEQITLFAREVAPRVRERVALERAHDGPRDIS